MATNLTPTAKVTAATLAPALSLIFCCRWVPGVPLEQSRTSADPRVPHHRERRDSPTYVLSYSSRNVQRWRPGTVMALSRS